jgi:GTP-binding protein Era
VGEYVAADLLLPRPRASFQKLRVGFFLSLPPPGSTFGVMSKDTTRAGHVAIIGLPNAGKSTLLNRLVGSKLSIVTPAAQTTRQRVVGIDTQPDAQIVFLDTPGLVRPANLLHRSMLVSVEQGVSDADVVVFVLDCSREPPELGSEAASILESIRPKMIIAINKTDASSASARTCLEEWSRATFGINPVAISAETGEGLGELRQLILERLPFSPFLFPEEELSTQSVRFFVEEMIRETIFERYGDEIPYAATVKVEEFREEDDPIYIKATIYVERASQKGIIIGRGGAAIRDLGTTARGKIETFLERGVYLDLWVKVLARWRKNPVELRRFGFPVPPDVVTRNA